LLCAVRDEDELSEAIGGCLGGSSVIQKGSFFAEKVKTGDAVFELVYSCHIRLYLYFSVKHTWKEYRLVPK
jgi:hypothetical protein